MLTVWLALHQSISPGTLCSCHGSSANDYAHPPTATWPLCSTCHNREITLVSEHSLCLAHSCRLLHESLAQTHRTASNQHWRCPCFY